jgi:hypothetical protein
VFCHGNLDAGCWLLVAGYSLKSNKFSKEARGFSMTFLSPFYGEIQLDFIVESNYLYQKIHRFASSNCNCTFLQRQKFKDNMKTSNTKICSNEGFAEINGLKCPALIQPLPRGENDRLLGRDVLNQLTTIFRGREKKVVFLKSRKR